MKVNLSEIIQTSYRSIQMRILPGPNPLDNPDLDGREIVMITLIFGTADGKTVLLFKPESECVVLRDLESQLKEIRTLLDELGF